MPHIDFFLNIDQVYQLTLCLISIGLTIAALEDIRTWSAFGSSGILSWKVSKSTARWSTKGIRARIANSLLSDRTFKASFYLRLLVSVLLLILSCLGIFSSILLFTEFLLLAFILLRNPYGLDGAYQMYLIILFALSLGIFFGIHSKISSYCLWFVVVQLLLSYFIAGIRKLLSPVWMKGYALQVIFGTKAFGNELFYRLIGRNKIISTIISLSVILFESLFFVILFIDPKYAYAFVIGGFLFHLSNAVFMGLNDFLFAFSAAYPILLYCIAANVSS